MVRRIFFVAILAVSLVLASCQSGSRITGSEKFPTAPDDTTDHQIGGGLQPASSWIRCSGMVQVYDRNNGDYDWLLVFYLPVNYTPAWMKVWAQNWYGGLGTPYVQYHGSTVVNGQLRVKYLAGSRVIAWYGSDPNRYYLEYP